MKQLKDIVLTGFLALLAFTACTEEKLIDAVSYTHLTLPTT